MAHLIRRRSMERLELYDLDKLSTNYQLPPPLPPPRIPHYHRRLSMNPTLERYQFLCNMTRNKTDPIYAATPMFTTIPQTSKEKFHRQLLGSYIRLENVKPLTPTIPKSPEPKQIEIIKDKNKQQEEEKENEDNNDDEKEENDDQFSGSSSSSSSSSDEQEKDNGNDILHDDDDKKGIVEQIFDRNKKD
jgi:hypothetical protein